jgi:uncharacterized cupredoxin-like copper-binding protein
MSQFFRLTLGIGLALLCTAFGRADGHQPDTSATVEPASMPADTIDVSMSDFAYEPDRLTVPAGQKVTLTFTNTGTVEHYFVVGDTIAGAGEGFRENLFGGVALEKRKEGNGHEEEEHAEGEEEENHENEFELAPGGRGSITFTLPESKAGTYTIACFETTGGEKHYELGMTGTLEVTPPEN